MSFCSTYVTSAPDVVTVPVKETVTVTVGAATVVVVVPFGNMLEQ